MLLPDAQPRRARDSRVPGVPMNVDMLDHFLSAPEWGAWALGNETADQRFYWRVIHKPDGKAAVYRDKEMIHRVSNDMHVSLFMGMLEVKPSTPAPFRKCLSFGPIGRLERRVW